MTGVNPKDYRSLVRADSSIRSSTRVLRVDSQSELSAPAPKQVPAAPQTSNNAARVTITATAPVPQALKSIPSAPEKTPVRNKSILNTESGNSSRIRPIQNVISAIKTMKTAVEDSNVSIFQQPPSAPVPPTSVSTSVPPTSVSTSVPPTSAPAPALTPSFTEPPETNKKIEALEKTIKTLEEKLESKHDALVEMWKIRDEMEVMRQTIRRQTTAQTMIVDNGIQVQKEDDDKREEELVRRVEQEKELNLRIDGMFDGVKQLIDEVSTETADKVAALDKKTDEREGKIETAVELLAKQTISLEKKEAVAETKISLLESHLRQKLSAVDEREGKIEQAVDLLEKQTTTLEKREADAETKIELLDVKINTETGRLQEEMAVVGKKVSELKDSLVKLTEIHLQDYERNERQIAETGEKNHELFSKSVSRIEEEIRRLSTLQETLQKEIREKVPIVKSSVIGDEIRLRKEVAEEVTKEIAKGVSEEMSSKIQSAVFKVQTERAEREREIVKEQKEIRDLISKTELKLMTEIKKAPALVVPTKMLESAAKEDSQLQERIRSLETELKILREKVGDVHTERRSRSNPRSRPHSSRELDPHRLAEFPVFVAELFNEQVILGDSGLQTLIVPKHWEVITDTDKGFDETGVYHVPFPGCYDINVIFKTVSTSVTAQIYVEHLGADGKIVKSYALDQGALVNESTGTVKLMNMNGGEGIRLRIQTRFNMALTERQLVEETLPDGTKHEHHVVYNMVQIAYSPVRGFCEC